jgi:mRNA export factor
MIDLGSGSAAATQVAAHDAPIKCARFVEVAGAAGPILVTGSWDKTVKYWDLRTPTPVASLECQDRIYTIDSNDKLLVVGTADRYINIVNLADPTKIYKTLQSPLKWQTRVVSCFTDATGFAVGSIEGRCAIQYVEDKDSAYVSPISPPLPLKNGLSSSSFAPESFNTSPADPNSLHSSNFSFKCHRQPPQGTTQTVYSVNAISFHPQHGTFSTAGSDGTFNFWDKDAKHRLKGYPEVGGTISATAFNRTGSCFAYAVSYDWSKGYQYNSAQGANKVMMHPIVGDECKPRAKTGVRK